MELSPIVLTLFPLIVAGIFISIGPANVLSNFLIVASPFETEYSKE